MRCERGQTVPTASPVWLQLLLAPMFCHEVATATGLPLNQVIPASVPCGRWPQGCQLVILYLLIHMHGHVACLRRKLAVQPRVAQALHAHAEVDSLTHSKSSLLFKLHSRAFASWHASVGGLSEVKKLSCMQVAVNAADSVCHSALGGEKLLCMGN